MELIVVSKPVACRRCGRGQGEHYGTFVLIRHRGLRVRMYGPGYVAIDCTVCGETNTVKLRESLNNQVNT